MIFLIKFYKNFKFDSKLNFLRIIKINIINFINLNIKISITQ